MHLSPAIVLALAGTNAASVLHNELRSEHTLNASIPAYDAILGASPAVLARNHHGKKVFLTTDNSCGKTGGGKGHGWYCDPRLPRGGACCSSNGWCGNGPLYCEAGCQKEFGHCDKDHKPQKSVVKCGPKNKNKKCSNDECCSSNGFCGKNKNFCGVGCQDKFGMCGNLKPNPAPKLNNGRCGPANNNQKCPNDQCCSGAGFCGIGIEFCAVPQNCLRGFGKCDSDVVPLGASTLKDPRPQLGKLEYGKNINDCKQPGTVALTFDDGPNVYTNELLDKLKVAGAKATFVVAGNTNGRGELDKGDVWPKLLKRMIAEGHQIASHTWSHPHMDAMTSEDRKMDMAKNERAIANVIGKYPTYMRPPYGECSDKSGCLKDLKDMGYNPLVGFDTLDWHNAAGHIQDSEKLVQRFFEDLGPDGHALLCQHDTLATSVQELTPLILEQVKHKGFRAVTVGECLGDDEKNWYRVPGKGTHARVVTKAEFESNTFDKGFLLPAARSAEPHHESDMPHDDGVIVIAPPDMPQAVSTSGSLAIAEDVETDHEMEADEMKIPSTTPKIPTFPSAEDLRTRDEDAQPGQHCHEANDQRDSTEHVLDIANCFTPEEIKADKDAKMSLENIADADAAMKRCIFTRGKFCGKIHHFHTKYGCFHSAKHCNSDMANCVKASNAEKLDDKDRGKEGCAKWNQICEEEVMFCKSCGTGKGMPMCNSRNFKPSNLKDLAGN